ncbi:MAG: sporulation protein YunB [Clostridiales bacterium]|jgi:sporulation protein YunB|nr:sporulation protein YunB [Clostridiales bacterium]
MPFMKRKHSFHRRRYRPRRRPFSPEKKLAIITIMVIIVIGVSALPISGFLKEVSSQIAISDAIDTVTVAINDEINDKMSKGQYSYDYFVNLEKDTEGNVTAISANMSRINTLSSEILRSVIESTNNGELDIDIPIGNLLGSNLLLGRGPTVPVKIIMLTSSFADFRNELSSAGINQIKHQIILEVRVEIDVLLPWELKTTEVLSEVLIAETIVVGKVPNTYLSLNRP